MAIAPVKYCTYCQKRDHDTNECWSTRAVTPHPTASAIPPANFPQLTFEEALAQMPSMSQELKDALMRARQPREKA